MRIFNLIKTKYENILNGSLSKPADGVLSRYFNRIFSSVISKRIVNKNISPNQISVFVLLFGFLTSFVIGIGFNIIGGIMIQLFSIADGIDGEIARLKQEGSITGRFIECMFDLIGEFSVILGMVYYEFCRNPNSFKIGYLVLFSFILYYGLSYLIWFAGSITEKAQRANSVSLIERLKFNISRDVWMGILALGTIFNLVSLTLIFFSIMRILYSLQRSVVFWSKTKRIIINEKI